MGGRGRVKTGGRKPGSRNKSSMEMVATFLKYNYEPVAHILDRIHKLDDREQIMVSLQLMNYVYPKLTAVKTETEPPPIELSSSQKVHTIDPQPSINFLREALQLPPKTIEIKTNGRQETSISNTATTPSESTRES